MKSYQLLLVSAAAVLIILPQQTNAFQIPQLMRKAPNSLISKIALPLGNINAPSFYKKLNILLRRKASILPNKPFAKPSAMKLHKKSIVADNKRILSIVTTCALTCLINRPSIARASTITIASSVAASVAFLDPMTLTYEIPGVDTTTTTYYGAYNLGSNIVRRSKPLLLLPVALVSIMGAWLYSGLVYYTNFLQDYEVGTYGSYEEDEYEEEEEATVLHHNADWKEYSQLLLDPSSVSMTQVATPKVHPSDATKDKDEEDQHQLTKANKFYQEQQYMQHHHPVHVPHSKFEQVKYLDTLAINNEYEKHQQQDANTQNNKSYLDTLSTGKSMSWDEYRHELAGARSSDAASIIRKKKNILQIMKNLLTWDDYKKLAGELQLKKNEVNELKQEVNHLQSLLNIEQSIHNHLQSSSSLTEVEVEATVEELVRTTTSSSSSSKTDIKVDTITDTATKEELKDLQLLTQEYEQTMKRALELKEEVEEYDMGSGIK